MILKNLIYLSVFALIFALSAFTVQDAHATKLTCTDTYPTYTIKDKKTCEDEQDGILSNQNDGFIGGKYFIINGKEYCFDASVQSNSHDRGNETMIIAPNITMINGKFLASVGHGNIINSGTIIGGTIKLDEGFNACSGTVYDDESHMFNSGKIYNLAEMENSGNFINSGTIYNTGTIANQEINYDEHIAKFNNTGKINNIGTFVMGEGETLFTNTGTISNQGTIKIALEDIPTSGSGALKHVWGTLTGNGNYGVFGEVPNTFTLSNMKTPPQVKTFKIFSGDGLSLETGDTLTIPSGYTLINAGTITNRGTIANNGILKQDLSSGIYFTHFETIEGGDHDYADAGVISGTGPIAIFGLSLKSLALPEIYPTATFSILQGDTMTISGGKSLIIPSGFTLNNAGTITNSGTIIDQGKMANLKSTSLIINPGNIMVFGSLQNNGTGTNGTITNTGTIFLCPGGTYTGKLPSKPYVSNGC